MSKILCGRYFRRALFIGRDSSQRESIVYSVVIPLPPKARANRKTWRVNFSYVNLNNFDVLGDSHQVLLLKIKSNMLLNHR